MKEGLDSKVKWHSLPTSLKEKEFEEKYKGLMKEAYALNLTNLVMGERDRAVNEFKTKHKPNGVKYREDMAEYIFERCNKILNDFRTPYAFFNYKDKKLYVQQKLF